MSRKSLLIPPGGTVAPGTYGDASNSAQITVDQFGRVIAASEVAISAGGGGDFSIFMIDRPPASPTAQDDEYGDATAFESQWTKVNWAGLTAYDVNSTKPDALWISIPTNAGDKIRAVLESIPAGDFTIITRVWCCQPATNYMSFGLIFTDGTTDGAGNQGTCSANWSASNGYKVSHLTFTNFSSSGTEVSGVSVGENLMNGLILRVRRSGTTYSFAYSFDGRTWKEFYSSTIGFTPTHFGVYADNNATSVTFDVAYDFFRYLGSASGQFGGLVALTNG